MEGGKSEIRIPARFLSNALANKNTKALRLLASAKLYGHRCDIKRLRADLKIHEKTCRRLIKKIVEQGWAGTDGTLLFPRSWKKLKLSKRGGLYITALPKDIRRFEALCFSLSLKKTLSRKAGPRSIKGRSVQMDLPTTYLFKALGLSERRFERLKAAAQRYRYISVHQQFTIVGTAKEYAKIKKHLMDKPVFIRGIHTVVPGLSKIKVLI